ncbi:3-oxoacyl-[acyl-carrier-protein] reductase [Ferroacidibacillus organovorans]|uniref:3-oxoacyl-[acyl-carrier-protein] reductase n=1 Tax=Ferroacidibacillus organovorans TaxID=1765683 RepID=A0A1V4ETJ1_9BACL|nr:3-oxoacyl-[acyl-carrier-protein] reductase [Ferroacidibacillus organovorans]OAG93389.1 beta-ketoacyl-ACP reductase [Ferroacidibacillus organovorans]OPG16160.1 3-oxoacyl-[acyl-carrier-protein] reductase [Ferroacidibacillus organovorans]
MELQNRVAIVTGASGGIGSATARELAEAGTRLVLAYHHGGERAEALAAEIRARGGECTVAQADVSTKEGAGILAKTAVEAYGGIDILVNNAGVTRDGLFLRMKEEDWDQVIDTNLKSVFLCSQAASKYLMRSAYGRIINIGSVVGLTGNAGQANYVAAKAGLVGLTKTLARELAARKVTVNVIAPGYITTRMTESIAPELSEKMAEQIPLGRLGQPGDVAALIRFLAGDRASYITGQVLQVDGGLVM